MRRRRGASRSVAADGDARLCRRADPRIPCSRKRHRRQPQFHCGNPPPAAAPRTRAVSPAARSAIREVKDRVRLHLPGEVAVDLHADADFAELRACPCHGMSPRFLWFQRNPIRRQRSPSRRRLEANRLAGGVQAAAPILHRRAPRERDYACRGEDRQEATMSKRHAHPAAASTGCWRSGRARPPPTAAAQAPAQQDPWPSLGGADLQRSHRPGRRTVVAIDAPYRAEDAGAGAGRRAQPAAQPGTRAVSSVSRL